MKPYGVLIHGAGWISTQHIAAYRQNPATRVVAISSRRLASARREADAAGLEGIGIYDDFAQALRHKGVDIVSVCTPQHVHCENVVAAAQAGKHLVIEKPAGLSPRELRRMQRAVREAGVKTVVSFVLRWNPLFQMLKRMIAGGAVGRVYCVEADYLSHNGGWWSGWNDTRTRKNGVSAMLVAGCHAVDALRWFAAPGESEAANPVEVFALAGGYRKGRATAYDPTRNAWIRNARPMEYDGLEEALVRFDNGVIGKVSVHFDCVMPYRFPIRIFGDRGTIFDNRVWSHHFPGQTDWIELPAIQPDSSDVGHHPFNAQIDHFVDCLRRGIESHCNLADAIKTHQVVFAALECYRTRRPVRIAAAAFS
ncbi:MAG TPA: Gfo/Idh/MocA family oxidoreductase [Candidatus Paceibacterota bacterium]|nr:Gfo/Idh/MocA family oxidoreductase [Candidatus Paceibacterota bacterium]HRZ91414.1 Gfo/Idh/MocA family oxidoreductase [Candidatus Paceibacterota bacterium]